MRVLKTNKDSRKKWLSLTDSQSLPNNSSKKRKSMNFEILVYFITYRRSF